jgi:hypothetical protein
MAADYESQVASLPTFVDVTDEIVQAGHLDPSIVPMLDRIDGHSAAISDRDDVWTLDALRTDPVWDDLRCRARDVMAAIGVEQSPPDMSFVTYVGGPKPPSSP